ncbi:MAG: EAL domain-containing protein [Gallionella sp.]|nr:EAL domain-containing protein [Gallionella sp.]
MRIFTRLLLLFLLVAVLPLALYSYLNLRQGEATLRQQALGRMSGLADKKAIQVKNYLAERVQDVRLLARGPRVEEAMGTISQEYAGRLKNAVNYQREDARARLNFERYVEEAGRFYDLFLITPEGEIIYSQKHESDFATNLITGPYRNSQLAYAFRAARMTLEPIVSGYEHYEPSQAPALFIAAPIMMDGQFKGVFAVQLGNELFYQVATDATGLGQSGEAAFARRDGDGVLYTTPLKYRSDAAMKFRLDRQQIKTTPMFGALSGESGEGVKLDYRGKSVVAAWRYLPGLDWGMVVEVDADEVFAPIYQQRTVLLQTLLALLLFAGLLAYYFGRQISRPLEGMARTADEVAGGSLDMRADESAPGELGLFACAFNRMTESLQVLYRSLEDRVEERTRELNVTNEELQEEIIEREQLESALRDSETYLRVSLEDLRYQKFALDQHSVVALTDVSGTITYVNDKFCEISGYAAQELIGQNHRLLNSGTHPAQFFSDMYRTIESGQVWSGEMCNRTRDKGLYWVRVTIVPYLDNDGKPAQYIAIQADITASKKAEEEIRNLAFYDVLTQLPNRRLLLDRINLALSVSLRSQHYGAVLFLDMDRFKTLNDTLGHDYGDLLLIEVAKRIQSCVREVDTVARLGGDEFVVLIEEIDAHAAEASQKVALIAEKIRLSLTVPYPLKGRQHHSSPSIGVCLYLGHEESADTLLKHADMAMYQAKDSGRNTVRFFDPKMQHAVEARAELEADLRHAVPDEQLHLYYQIQLDNEQRALGAEALVRWIHPTRGMVSPAQFIPVAEESALILEIGAWVLETACRQLSDWSKNELTRNLSISVNVSAQQFKLVDFVDKVEATLQACGAPAALLKLELTESVVLSDVADVVAKMHALKALGVQLSLDDFGTGYSSLSYLKRLPLDQLKIDQSFVRDIATDANDAVMVHAIIDMAHNFGLDVIAEGVETEDQLAFLKLHGCMAYQGYLFSKPVPVEAFEKLLGRGNS